LALGVQSVIPWEFVVVGGAFNQNMFVAAQKAEPVLAKKVLFKAMKLDRGVKTKFTALKVLGQMTHGCGSHMEAADLFTEALALPGLSNPQMVEALFYRGTALLRIFTDCDCHSFPSARSILVLHGASLFYPLFFWVNLVLLRAAVCYHGLGYHDQAEQDYRKAFSITLKTLSEDDLNHRKLPEIATLQFLSWYQRELALYMKNVLDHPVHDISLDLDLPPEFKVTFLSQSSGHC
jgi:tetratricopeptide (TPR) repeat protein